MARYAVPVTMGSPRFHTVEVEGFLVTEAHFAARDALPPHYHARPVVAVMLEGSFDVVFPRRRLFCPPATLHTEPAEERHDNRLGDAGAHVLVVQPDPRRTDALRPFLAMLDRINHVPQSPVTGLAWRLARELHLADTAAPLAIEGLTLELLALAARAHGSHGRAGGSKGGGPPPAWLKRAEELLHAHFADRLRIADVAAAAGVHPEHLARVFRRHCGVSLATYVRRLRLDWAALQLAASREEIARIALRAGFADQSHFTRAFKRHAGLTPGRYRRSAAAARTTLPGAGSPLISG